MRMRWITAAVVVAMATLGFLAWRNSTQPAAEAPAPSSAPDDPAPAEPADPGIAWDVPAGWTETGARSMRIAAYTIDGSGSAADAECAVYYFGPGQGGAPDANIERWLGEFERAQDPRRWTRTVRGMQVSLARVRGTYQSHGGSAAPEQGGGEALGDHQLLGAIVEGPNGLVFFKLTGPSATIEHAAADFDRMIGSLRGR